MILIAASKPNDPKTLAATHRGLSRLIADGHVAACHDLSDGGLISAAAEMSIASGKGLNLSPDLLMDMDVFAEESGRYLVEISQLGLKAGLFDKLETHFAGAASSRLLGFVQNRPRLMIMTKEKVIEEIPIEEMATAWRGTLDW